MDSANIPMNNFCECCGCTTLLCSTNMECNGWLAHKFYRKAFLIVFAIKKNMIIHCSIGVEKLIGQLHFRCSHQLTEWLCVQPFLCIRYHHGRKFIYKSNFGSATKMGKWDARILIPTAAVVAAASSI